MAVNVYKPAKLGPNVTQAEATSNRRLFEVACLKGGDTEVVPAGFVAMDRATHIVPSHGLPLRLIGNGSTFATKFYTGGYPDNCSLVVLGEGTGWADGIIRGSAPTSVVVAPEYAGNYPVGRVAYSFKYDGYTNTGQVCRRHVVANAASNILQLTTAPDATATHLKWVRGVALERADAGMCRLKFAANADTPAVGSTVLITAGPLAANEAPGEFRTVLAVEGNELVIDRPLRKAWPDAAACTGPFVEGVTLENLTLAQPKHPDADPLFAKLFRGLRLVNVAGMAPGERTRPFTVATGAEFNCDGLTGPGVQLNGVNDSTLRNVELGTLTLEEICFDVTLKDFLLCGSPYGYPGRPWVNGIQALTGTTDLHVENGRLTGYGAPSPFGSGSALIGAATDCTFRNVQVGEHAGWGMLYWGGDRNRFEGLDSSHPLLCDGAEYVVIDARLPYVEFRANARATCVGVYPSMPQYQGHPTGRVSWLGGGPSVPMGEAIIDLTKPARRPPTNPVWDSPRKLLKIGA